MKTLRDWLATTAVRFANWVRTQDGPGPFRPREPQ